MAKARGSGPPGPRTPRWTTRACAFAAAAAFGAGGGPRPALAQVTLQEALAAEEATRTSTSGASTTRPPRTCWERDSLPYPVIAGAKWEFSGGWDCSDGHHPQPHIPIAHSGLRNASIVEKPLPPRAARQRCAERCLGDADCVAFSFPALAAAGAGRGAPHADGCVTKRRGRRSVAFAAECGRPSPARDYYTLLQRHCTVNSPFDGMWTEQDRPGAAVFEVNGSTIRWDGAFETELRAAGLREFATRLGGADLHARLRDGRILWASGRVWTPLRSAVGVDGVVAVLKGSLDGGKAVAHGVVDAGRTADAKPVTSEGPRERHPGGAATAPPLGGHSGASAVAGGAHPSLGVDEAAIRMALAHAASQNRSGSETKEPRGSTAAAGKSHSSASALAATRKPAAPEGHATSTRPAATIGAARSSLRAGGHSAEKAEDAHPKHHTTVEPPEPKKAPTQEPKGGRVSEGAKQKHGGSKEEHEEGPAEALGEHAAPATKKHASNVSEVPREVDCFIQDATYQPLDMEGSAESLEDDASACQKRCGADPRCAHFSFWQIGPGPGVCHLQDAYSVRTEAAPGFTAGPARCPQDAASKPDTSTDLPGCMSVGWAYFPPLPGGARAISSAEVPDREDAVKACKAFCASVAQCAYFVMDFNSRLCSLADTSAQQTWWGGNVVSGTPVCHPTTRMYLAKGIAALRQSLQAFLACCLVATGVVCMTVTTLHRFTCCVPKRFTRWVHCRLAVSSVVSRSMSRAARRGRCSEYMAIDALGGGGSTACCVRGRGARSASPSLHSDGEDDFQAEESE